MKLHHLRLRGITEAFPNEVCVDFDSLGEGLIAIVGENGANKPGIARFWDFRSPRWYWRPHANTWLAFTPCARATRAADAPGAKVSSTIWRFSSGPRYCRLAVGSALREEIASITAEFEPSI